MAATQDVGDIVPGVGDAIVGEGDTATGFCGSPLSGLAQCIVSVVIRALESLSAALRLVWVDFGN